MALCSECTDQFAQKVLDGADIVRDAILRKLPVANRICSQLASTAPKFWGIIPGREERTHPPKVLVVPCRTQSRRIYALSEHRSAFPLYRFNCVDCPRKLECDQTLSVCPSLPLWRLDSNLRRGGRREPRQTRPGSGQRLCQPQQL
jgi:hypothetical protein